MIRRVLWMLALGAVCLSGEESGDREAVRRAIEGLNERNWRAAVITSDPTAIAQFERLLRGRTLSYRIRPETGRPVLVARPHGLAGRTSVTLRAPSIELSNPRVVVGAVRFVSEDVATADASLVEQSGTVKRSTPLLFVMKKDAGVWKIAELKLLAPDPQLLA